MHILTFFERSSKSFKTLRLPFKLFKIFIHSRSFNILNSSSDSLHRVFTSFFSFCLPSLLLFICQELLCTPSVIIRIKIIGKLPVPVAELKISILRWFYSSLLRFFYVIRQRIILKPPQSLNLAMSFMSDNDYWDMQRYTLRPWRPGEQMSSPRYGILLQHGNKSAKDRGVQNTA